MGARAPNNNFIGDNAPNNWPTNDFFCVTKVSKIKSVVTTWVNSSLKCTKTCFLANALPQTSITMHPTPSSRLKRGKPSLFPSPRYLCYSLLVYWLTHLHSSNTPLPLPTTFLLRPHPVPQCWICEGCWRGLTLRGDIADPPNDDLI